MSSLRSEENLLLLTDSYKLSHWKQYPPGTQKIYSYLESRRGGRYPQTVFFGLQYLLKRYLSGPVLTLAKVNEAASLVAAHMGEGVFNRSGFERLIRQHEGRLPISIRAVPEGMVVPTGNVLLTIENLDPEFPWLTNYLETLILQVWYPTTVATQSFHMKKTIASYLAKTGTPDLLMFKLHDFGFRGVSSVETAGLGGAAHLVNFKGTDTLAGITLLKDYYHAADMSGFSIPASEHSTIISWGEGREADAMENLLDQFPEGLLACVSDSYDIERACRDIWGTRLREKILARKGTLVVRPDSGDPVTMVLRVLQILGERFGVSLNQKGYKVLPDQIRVIQGDGIDPYSLENILSAMEQNRWSADNITFGSGGALLQKLDRDTQRFALKCSAICVSGHWEEVRKAPATDPSKDSKKGRLKLIRSDEGVLRTVPESGEGEDLLREVFRNGQVLVEDTLDTIRTRADGELAATEHFHAP